MGNVIFGSLNAQDISDSFLFEELDVFGSFEVRADKDVFSDVGDPEFVERVLVVNLNVSVVERSANAVGAVVGLFLDVDPAGVAFDFDLFPFPHKQVLETLPAFVHVKCKRINSLILGQRVELMVQFLVLVDDFERTAGRYSFHSVVYLPPAQLADVSYHKVLVHVLCSLHAQV